MVNVEVVDKFQLEFDLYETKKDFSFGYAHNEIFRNLEEVDVARSFIDLEKKRNRRRRIISGILGKHAERFGYFDPYYYDMDDACLDRKRETLDVYYGQLNSVHSEIDDENFVEVFRLMSFARRKNRDFRLSIEEEREAIRKSASGEEVDIPAPTHEFKAFNEWFGPALENASYVERVENVKK